MAKKGKKRKNGPTGTRTLVTWGKAKHLDRLDDRTNPDGPADIFDKEIRYIYELQSQSESLWLAPRGSGAACDFMTERNRCWPNFVESVAEERLETETMRSCGGASSVPSL